MRRGQFTKKFLYYSIMSESTISKYAVWSLTALALFLGTATAQRPDSSRFAPLPYRPLVATGPQAGPEVRDSVSRLVEQLAILRLNDSLEIARRSLLPDTGLMPRPGRAMLRVADSSLFSSHAGSVGGDYPLGPGDVLVLSMWGQKQARYELEVDRDGQAQIPSVGPISLNGVDFKDAKNLFAQRLSASYSGIKSGLTQIDLTLAKFKQVRIYVVGDVNRPGGYLLSGATTSLQAIAIAGGPRDRGSERIVRVTRGAASFDVDLYEYLFRGRRPKRDVLQDGDILMVPSALGTVRVEGAIARPGHYEVLPSESLADVVALAGGPSANCDLDAPIRWVHEQSTNRFTSLVGSVRQLDSKGRSVVVTAGDVVTLPHRGVSRRASPFISGNVRNPGSYPYESGLTLRKLIAIAGGPTTGALLRRIVVIRTDSLGTGVVLNANAESGPDLAVFPTDSIIVGNRLQTDSISQVQISGSVRNPGVYNWYKGIRLIDLLTIAGGALPSSDLKSVQVAEKSGKGDEFKSQILSVDSTGAGSPLLSPYSHVIVPSATSPSSLPMEVKLSGQVRSPGVVPLLYPQERISSVLKRTGGVLATAYPDGAVVWRGAEGRIPANLATAMDDPGSSDDIVLRSDDSIHVPERPSTVLVVGMVNHPTKVLWRKGKDWSWYVRSAGDFADSANKEAVYVQYADGSIQSNSQGPDDPTPGSTVVVPRKDPPRPVTSVEKLSGLSSVVAAFTALATVYILYLATEK